MSTSTQQGARGRDSGAPYLQLRVRPLAGALGAEVRGADAAQALPAAVVEELARALREYLVIVLLGQSLTPQQLTAFARTFGEPMEYPQVRGLPEAPLVTAVTKLEHERVNFGGVWHSDTSYLPRPPKISMLYAVELPQVGGDTLFANQYLAYETLSGGLQATLAGLNAVNVAGKNQMAQTRQHRLDDAGAKVQELSSTHPVVRTHPETARKALYVNAGHTLRFDGWTEQESVALLAHLFNHQTRPELTCRYRWQPGALAIWDNRCTQHLPVNDYHGYRRVMHRITVAGDEPR